MDTINLCPKFNHGIVRYPRIDGGGPTLTDIHLSDIQQETALRLALLSGDVLHGCMQTKGAEGIHRLHRSSAAAHGLIRANGRIRIDDLDQLIGLYCNCLPVNIEFSVVRCRLFDCALKLLRKPREAIVHPMAF